jgi:hypothetical protein
MTSTKYEFIPYMTRLVTSFSGTSGLKRRFEAKAKSLDRVKLWSNVSVH